MRNSKGTQPILIGLLLFFAAIYLSSCAGSGVAGSGNVTTESRQVSGFNEISLRGITVGGNLIIEQGDEESLRIEAEDNIIPLIITEVRGDRLIIRYSRRAFIRPTKPINFFITVQDLSAISSSGSGSVRSSGLETDELRISTSGSAEVDLEDIVANELRSRSSGSSRFDLSGRVERQEVHISGFGEYLARDLESKECIIDFSGSGNAIVNVRDRLDVDIGGSGEVSYIGDPTVNQNISGSGRVRKISESTTTP